jgi:hypothetical protein
MKHLSFILFVLFPVLLLAQATVRVGEASKKGTSTTDRAYLLDTKNQALLAVKGYEDKFTIFRYDLNTLNETHRSSTVALIADNTLETVYRIHGQYYFTYDNARDSKLKTRIRRIDVEEKLPALQKTLLKDNDINTILYYQTEIDADLTVIGLYKDEKAPFKATYLTVGADLEETSRMTFELPVLREKTYYSGGHLDKAGNYYFLLGTPLAREKGERWKRPTEYTLYKFNPTIKKVETFGTVNINRKHISRVNLIVEDDQRIALVASYNTEEVAAWSNSALTKGFVLAQYDPATKKFNTTAHNFPYETVSQYKTSKEREYLKELKKNGKLGLIGLDLMHSAFNEDGSIVLTFEENGYSTRFAEGYADVSTYAKSTLFVVKMTANGKMDWITPIPKRYVGYLSGPGAYYAYEAGQHCYYYCDHKDNKNLKTDEVPTLYKDDAGVVAVTKIDDQTGASTKDFLFLLYDNPTGKKFDRFGSGGIIVSDNNKILLDAREKREGNRLIEISQP